MSAPPVPGADRSRSVARRDMTGWIRVCYMTKYARYVEWDTKTGKTKKEKKLEMFFAPNEDIPCFEILFPAKNKKTSVSIFIDIEELFK